MTSYMSLENLITWSQNYLESNVIDITKEEEHKYTIWFQDENKEKYGVVDNWEDLIPVMEEMYENYF